MTRALIPVLLALSLGACSGPVSDVVAPPQPGEPTFLEADMETSALAPSGSVRLVSKGDGEVLISAGFFNRNKLARIRVPSEVQWAPDSRRLFINDSGSAAWSTFRLFEISSNGVGKERTEIHRAAVAELARLNGCVSAPEPDATTHGMAWAAEGRQVYVLAQARRETGNCHWGPVEYIVVVADVETGRLLEVAQGAEARRRYPHLPWAPL